MSKKNQQKIENIRAALRANEIEEDRYGNFIFKTSNGTNRYKFGKTALRAEVKIGNTWVRRWSAYYKYINISEANQLSFTKRIR